jgi:hypothetical protein
MIKKWDRPYPSHLLRGEVIHGLPRQDTVGLIKPSLYLINSFMWLFFRRIIHPINPGFEIPKAVF